MCLNLSSTNSTTSTILLKVIMVQLVFSQFSHQFSDLDQMIAFRGVTFEIRRVDFFISTDIIKDYLS